MSDDLYVKLQHEPSILTEARLREVERRALRRQFAVAALSGMYAAGQGQWIDAHERHEHLARNVWNLASAMVETEPAPAERDDAWDRLYRQGQQLAGALAVIAGTKADHQHECDPLTLNKCRAYQALVEYGWRA